MESLSSFHPRPCLTWPWVHGPPGGGLRHRGGVVRQWLQYDTRTDDITIIIAHGVGQGCHGHDRREGLERRGDDERQQAGQRALAKDKRKLIEQEMGRSNEEDEEEDWDELEIVKVPKSKSELDCITLAVRANFLFSHIKDEQKQIIYDVMEKEEVNAGQTVIKQGERETTSTCTKQGVRCLRAARGQPSLGAHIHH